MPERDPNRCMNITKKVFQSIEIQKVSLNYREGSKMIYKKKSKKKMIKVNS